MRYMHLDQKTLEERTLMRGKITAIIPTSTAPFDMLRWTVLSLLCRSDPTHLEHLIVTINGPDERTGDPSLQEEKELWLRRLLRAKWRGRDMPLTIQRTLSRLGHAQALESAAAWVHTEFYLSIHDDVIVMAHDWTNRVLAGFTDPRLAVQVSAPLAMGALGTFTTPDGRPMLSFPHLSTHFTAVRKSALIETGARWPGYHVEGEFVLPAATIDRLTRSHQPHVSRLERGEHKIWSQDIGAWVWARLEWHGYRVVEIPKDVCIHFLAASWYDPEEVQRRKEIRRAEIEALKAEVLSGEFAEFWE